jgi:universal stress protein E
MSRIHRILYAVDQADSASEAAFRKVVAIAKSCNASVELFHAITSALMLPMRTAGARSIEDLKRECVELHELRLARLAACARNRGVAITWSAAWDHPPHEAIVRRAERSGADLIIVECHKGKRGNPRLMYLTDFELLRNSKLPVLLLKDAAAYRRPLVLAAVDPAHAHSKPLDLDTRILADASDIAASMRGKLHVVHACNPSLIGLAYGDLVSGAYAASLTQDDLEKQERGSFEKLMSGSRVPAARQHFMEGDPARAISRVARELRAGLVVMGAVSRSGLKRAFIGNTAERVLRELPCDVLVVKPAAFEKRVRAARRSALVFAPGPNAVVAD